MICYNEKIIVQSTGGRPSFHDISEKVKEAVMHSEAKQGICTIYSHHTTCSVMIQELSHDRNFYGLEYLQIGRASCRERV